MNKKHRDLLTPLIVLLPLLFASCATNSRKEAAVNLFLDEAIKNAAGEIESLLPMGTGIALTNVVSESSAVSDYIIEELTTALINGGKLRIVDQNTLNRALANAELDFQMSGEISDETQVSIGKLMGVQQVVSGLLVKQNASWQLKLTLADVETVRRKSLTPQVINDEKISFLWNQKDKPVPNVLDNPVTAHEYADRAYIYADRKEYLKALEDFTQAIRLGHPDLEAMYVGRGWVNQELGKYDEAVADYTEAINRNANFAYAYHYRAIAYFSTGNFDKSITDASRAIQLTPNLASSYVVRGSSYGRMGEFDKVIADAGAAIKLEPDRANSYSLLGAGYIGKGELEKAEEAVKQCLRLNPKHAESREGLDLLGSLYFERGMERGGRGNHAAALNDFDGAIRLNPKRADAYVNRGMAYYFTGDIGRAIADLEQAARMVPDNISIRNTLERMRRQR